MSKASISIDYSPKNNYETLRSIYQLINERFWSDTTSEGEDRFLKKIGGMLENVLSQEKIEYSINEECRKPKDTILLYSEHAGTSEHSWSRISSVVEATGIVKMVLDNSKLIEYESEDQYIEILLDSFSSRLMTPVVLSKIKECFETFLGEAVFLFVRINEEDVNQSY